MKRRGFLGALGVGAAAVAGVKVRYGIARVSEMPIPRVRAGSPMRAKDFNALIDRVNQLTRELAQMKADRGQV